mmetsp:Transcript_25378/g.63847  ORF Transcript_25378/g.63847 Transcript_25378/m.63847 type:complete len:206 (+) Transcript_25378:1280-1897(+)
MGLPSLAPGVSRPTGSFSAAAAAAAAKTVLSAEGLLEDRGDGESADKADDHSAPADPTEGPLPEPTEDLKAVLSASCAASSSACDGPARAGKAKKFQISVTKSTSREENRLLGLDTKAFVESAQRSALQKEKGALRVTRVKSEGLIADWNSMHRRRQVQEGDFIIEVNGVRGKPEDLYTVIASDSELQITILRLPATAVLGCGQL